MKKIIFSALAALAFVGVSCSSDDNSIGNGDGGVTPPNKNIKLISQVVTVDDAHPADKLTFNVNYDNDSKVTSVVGNESNDEYFVGEATFKYEEKTKLTEVKAGGDLFPVQLLLDSNKSLYKYGKVLEYDKKGNPTKILMYYDEYLFEELGGTKQGILELEYDNNPNFTFHTMRAMGIIDAIKGVNVIFNDATGNPVNKLLSELISVNNMVKGKVYLEDGTLIRTTTVTYDFDEQLYPKSAVVTNIGIERDYNFQNEVKYIPYSESGRVMFEYKK
ncbi:hypothetical protein [Myroides odoratimimus]|uniref:hypothetical protein n=1 Tax=Myroides odoratimimus TaxID=76832 RepID=UPI00310149B8